MATVEWSRWKVWILFLLVVLGTAVVLIPGAEGAGIDQFASGDYAGAVAAFEEELTLTTGAARAPVLNNIGTCYMALGQAEQASGYYEQAVSADSSYGRGWINLGVVQEQLGRQDEALASYGKVSGDPAMVAEAAVKKGTLLAGQQKLDEALAAFNAGIAGASGTTAADLYTGIGAVSFMQKKATEAEEAFVQAIDADPEGAVMAWTNLGVLQISQGRYAEARASFETAISHDPTGISPARTYLANLESQTAGNGVVEEEA